VVGFRSAAPQRVENGELQLDDQNLQHIYIHDDNLGPNARFLVKDGDEVPPISPQRCVTSTRRERHERGGARHRGPRNSRPWSM
jgi:hypothetical protein